jgi:light-regulated signal transduction histidine kinase (bacteriophytochrome)
MILSLNGDKDRPGKTNGSVDHSALMQTNNKGNGKGRSVAELIGVIKELLAHNEEKDALIAQLMLEKEEAAGCILQLQMENKDLESFSHSVSHDLNAPLRSIHMCIQLLEEDLGAALKGEAKVMLQVINDCTLKMGRLIEHLLEFSRLGKKAISPVAIDMNTLTDEVLMDLAFSPPHNATITHDDLIPVMADRLLTEQILVNLISNAIKYSSRVRKPLVHISCKQDVDEVIYTIKDNGVGFDMKYANKLFCVFQRLHSDEEFPGTGLGLSIVHRIVQKHNGRIWAASKPGEGATFFFSLRQA